MLKRLKDLIDAVLPPQSDAGQASEHTLELATAVLLVEVMRANPAIDEVSRHAVLRALREKFALSADECDELLELAEATAREATDLFTFTTRINDAFTMEQKVRMIEHMWRVAYADGTLTAHENHVMWRVSDLLYIPHGAYVGAKMRAKVAASA